MGDTGNPLALWRITVLIAFVVFFWYQNMYIVHCAEYELVCWCHGEPPCPLADNCEHSPHPASWVRVGQRASNTGTQIVVQVIFSLVFLDTKRKYIDLLQLTF